MLPYVFSKPIIAIDDTQRSSLNNARYCHCEYTPIILYTVPYNNIVQLAYAHCSQLRSCTLFKRKSLHGHIQQRGAPLDANCKACIKWLKGLDASCKAFNCIKLAYRSKHASSGSPLFSMHQAGSPLFSIHKLAYHSVHGMCREWCSNMPTCSMHLARHTWASSWHAVQHASSLLLL